MAIKATCGVPILVVGSLALMGCGQTNRPEPVPEDVPAAFVMAVCEHAVACGQDPDLATCLAVFSVSPTLAGRLAALRGGRALKSALSVLYDGGIRKPGTVAGA